MKNPAVILIVCAAVLMLCAPGVGAAEEKSSKELERDARRASMKMGTGGIEFGLGVNKFQVVLLYEDEVTLHNFIEKGLILHADLSAPILPPGQDLRANCVEKSTKGPSVDGPSSRSVEGPPIQP